MTLLGFIAKLWLVSGAIWAAPPLNCTTWQLLEDAEVVDHPVKPQIKIVVPRLKHLCLTADVIQVQSVFWSKVYLYKPEVVTAQGTVRIPDPEPKWVPSLILKKKDKTTEVNERPVQRAYRRIGSRNNWGYLQCGVQACSGGEKCEEGFCSKLGHAREKELACENLKKNPVAVLKAIQSYLCQGKELSCAKNSEDECVKDFIHCQSMREYKSDGMDPGPLVYLGCKSRSIADLTRTVLAYYRCLENQGEWRFGQVDTSLRENPERFGRCICPLSAKGDPQEFLALEGCAVAKPGFDSQWNAYKCSDIEIYQEGFGCLKKADICSQQGGEWFELTGFQSTEYMRLEDCKKKKASRWEESPYPPLGKCKDRNSIPRFMSTGSETWICDQIQKQALEKNKALLSFEPVKESFVLCSFQPLYKSEPSWDYFFPTPYGTAKIIRPFCRKDGKEIEIGI